MVELIHYQVIYLSYIACVLLILLVRRRVYPVLLLLAFSLPFKSAYWQIEGSYLEIWKSISIILLPYTLWNFLSKKAPKWFFFLLAFTVYITLVTLFTFVFLGIPQYSKELGLFKTSARPLSQILLMLSYINLLLVFYYGKLNSNQILNVLRAFVLGVFVSVMLGIVQWLFIEYLEKNLFPIPRLSSELQEEVRVSSLETVLNLKLNRIYALSMEPKNLATFIVFGLVLVFEYIRLCGKHFLNKTSTIIISALSLFVLFNTFSSLGYILFSMYVLYVLVSSINQRSLKALSILFLILCTGYLYFQSDRLVSEIILKRSLERIYASSSNKIYLEDFDEATLFFFFDNYEYLLTGIGLGNIHRVASEYLPDYAIGFATGTAWHPKSGLLFMLSAGGLIGMLFLSIFLYEIWNHIPKRLGVTVYFKSIFLFSVLAFVPRFNEFLFLLGGVCLSLATSSGIQRKLAEIPDKQVC